jgi:hypothetical protein
MVADGTGAEPMAVDGGVATYASDACNGRKRGNYYGGYGNGVSGW